MAAEGEETRQPGVEVTANPGTKMRTHLNLDFMGWGPPYLTELLPGAEEGGSSKAPALILLTPCTKAKASLGSWLGGAGSKGGSGLHNQGSAVGQRLGFEGALLPAGLFLAPPKHLSFKQAQSHFPVCVPAHALCVRAHRHRFQNHSQPLPQLLSTGCCSTLGAAASGWDPPAPHQSWWFSGSAVLQPLCSAGMADGQQLPAE